MIQSELAESSLNIGFLSFELKQLFNYLITLTYGDICASKSLQVPCDTTHEADSKVGRTTDFSQKKRQSETKVNI